MGKRSKYSSVYYYLLLFIISCQSKSELDCYDVRNEILEYGFDEDYYPNVCSKNTDMFLDMTNNGHIDRLYDLYLSNKPPSNGIENILYNEMILASFGFGYSVYFDILHEYSDSIETNSFLDLDSKLEYHDLDFNNLFFTHKYFLNSELFLHSVIKENRKYVLFKNKVIIDDGYFLSDKDSTFLKQYFQKVQENILCLDSWEDNKYYYPGMHLSGTSQATLAPYYDMENPR